MIAQYITLGAETVALCVARPNLEKSRPQLDLKFPSDVGRHPISKRESRRTFARSARYAMRYIATLRTADEATEMAIWLAQLKRQTVAIPLWLDGCVMTAAHGVGATAIAVHDHPVRSGFEWIIANSDFSVYEIVHVPIWGPSGKYISNISPLTLNWPAGSVMYPLVFGRLERETKMQRITPSRVDVEIRFKESSPYARRLNAYPVAIGNVGPGVPSHPNHKLWLVHPVWSQVVNLTDNRVDWQEALGFGREDQASSYESQPVERGLEMEFRCAHRKDIAAIETFFADRKGRVSTFFIATGNNDLELNADVAPGATTLFVKIGEYSDDTRIPHQGDPYIAAVEPIDPRYPHMDQTDSIEPLKIDTVSGGVLTLDNDPPLPAAVVALPHTKARTRLSFCMLVRLVEPELKWSYGKNGVATTRLKFLELPNEYEAPSAVLPEEAWLYYFVEETPYPRSWLYTSYEEAHTRTVDWVGTYTPAQISHGSLRRSLDLGANKLTIRTGNIADSPLRLFFPYDLEGKLRLYVLWVNVNNPAQPAVVMFSGEVSEPNPDLTEATCKQFGNLERRKVPNFILSGVDNFGLFSRASGINRATYKVTGLITAINGSTVEVGAGGDKADDWFNGGELEMGTTPTTYQSRPILDSDPIVGGVRLVLDRPLLRGAAVGNSVDIYPGYDGTIGQRETKFGDRGGHGGHAYVADTPPNIKGVKAKEPSGGKK